MIAQNFVITVFSSTGFYPTKEELQRVMNLGRVDFNREQDLNGYSSNKFISIEVEKITND